MRHNAGVKPQPRTATGERIVPVPMAQALDMCVRALEAAQFRDVLVGYDACSVTASRLLGSQWTRSHLTVDLVVVEGGTRVVATSSVAPESLLSFMRPPGQVLVRRFLRYLADVESSRHE
jgi:hypothetical protein